MELRDYIKIIQRSKSLVASITLTVPLIILVWTIWQPVQFEANATLVVNKPNPVPQRNANYYQYDKYYSIQASSLYADTLTAWLSSPGTAKEIYEQAGLPVPELSLKKLSKIFKPRRLQPVGLSISIIDPDQDKAQRLVRSAVAVLQQKVSAQQRGDDPDQYFTTLDGAVVSAPTKPDLVVTGLLGLIVGLLLALATAYLRDYLKPTKN